VVLIPSRMKGVSMHPDSTPDGADHPSLLPSHNGQFNLTTVSAWRLHQLLMGVLTVPLEEIDGDEWRALASATPARPTRGRGTICPASGEAR
jgi:hypothetical protein